MQQQAKLIVAELKDKQKIEFLIFDKQVVGKGMSGEVKKAIRNDKPNQLLVVKIIPCQNDVKRQKIDREIGIIKQLPDHQNLVRVEPYECFSKNNYYIFMEYCPDGTLDDLRVKKNNIFSQDEIFDIFYQLMNGYRVLWNAKILHQDLKPQNVLVKNKELKLADFGFSIFYQGVKHGSVRVGTLPYMPLQKLTEKQYYATTKSDMYSMGIILFKLITGHHPYVQKSNKDYKSYVRELKANSFYLKPNFSNRFSIKFQHFFDLVCKMVAKYEKDRIDFDVVYDYIENEAIFSEIRDRVKIKQKQVQNNYGKVNIIGESEAVAIDFERSLNVHHAVLNKDMQQEQAKQLLKLQKQEQQRIVNELQKYIASHRIIVYYFDRLTRRLYIQKTKKNGLGLSGKKNEKLILGLILFCKKIVQNMLKECKGGMIFPLNNWRVYRKKSTGLLKMIERDQNYLQDMLIDSLSESTQTQMIQKKQMIQLSKQDFDKFKEQIINQLKNVYKDKKSHFEIGNRQNLITLCYIKSGLCILNQWKKYSADALEFEGYFRSVQTLSEEELLSKFLHEDDIGGDMVIDIGDEQ